MDCGMDGLATFCRTLGYSLYTVSTMVTVCTAGLVVKRVWKVTSIVRLVVA